MKNCIETIRAWVNQVSSIIADVEIVYGINHYMDYHVVIVRPSSVYNGDSYMKLEECFNNELYNQFPDENIIITDDDSIMDITEVIIIKSAHFMEREPINKKYEFLHSNHYSRVSSENSYALAA